MDFFDLSKPYNKILLNAGQTKGFIKVNDDSNKKVKTIVEEKDDYTKKYVEKERNELMKQVVLEEQRRKEYEKGRSSDFMDTNSSKTENLNEDSVKIYAQYMKHNKKETKDLIISKAKEKILSMIELNEVVIISGPTGCGKTTQVPQYILESYAEKNKYCNIIVTQPRRIATITVPRRVCEERNWTVGSICGYKVGLINCTSEDTRLTYVTVGVFLQILLHQRNMNQYTHVILDEIHERDQTMDFVLMITKKFLQTNSRNVKVILMSATADVSKFATYFERPIYGKLQPAPIINIQKSKEYVVQIHYLEELSPLGELPVINTEDPQISDLQIILGIQLIKQFERLDHSQMPKKSVLVFLPGIFEIEIFYDKLKDPKIYKMGDQEFKWHPIPLHSSITLEEQAQAFLPPPVGYRKIILATNIAESSITVPDVMFVIDYCLTKILITDEESNFTSLQTTWASKANLIQRGGRAGRVMDGRVYRMIYKDDYDKLDDHCMPEMLRCPLEKIILQAKLLGMGSPKAVLALTIDPPNLSNIEKTVLLLKEVGGLLRTSNGVVSKSDGDLTFLGSLMAEMPVDIHITKLIALGYVYNCLQECIIMGAAMSLKSVFNNPFQARLMSYNSKLDWADGSCSDCIAFLNVYDVWRMNHTRGYYKRSQGGGETNWAKRHFIQLRSLKEVKILVEDLQSRLKLFGMEPAEGAHQIIWNESEKALVLKFVIAGAFYPNYFTRGARGGQVDEKEAVRCLSGRDPFTTVYIQNYPLNQPPDLYSHSIRELMSDCKEDMTISYDHSKVFIEFRDNNIYKKESDLPFSNRVPGRISMAVYRAVKMRDVMKTLEIKVLNPEEAKKQADLLKKKAEEKQRSLETGDKDQMSQSVVPGLDISFIPINITHVVDPGNFWATQKDVITQKHEKNLFKWLNCPDADIEGLSDLPKVGDMCAAPYEVGNGKWLYRARIDCLFGNLSEGKAKVFFIDYGNSENVPIKSLRKYGPRLLEAVSSIPGQAFQCKLTNIKPSPVKNPGGQWCQEARKKFDELVEAADLIGSIYSVVNGVISLVLYKIENDVNDPKQININKLLVDKGFAEVCEESYLSKINNEARIDRQSEFSENSNYNTLFRKFWMPPPPIGPECENSKKIPVKLRGPFSPLEMKIFSSIQSGSSKLVKMSPVSVNSVLLDSDPQDPHERLIVAAHVAQNSSGTTLTLHNTTVMPNIHGLAALIPFVFAPAIEFRVNEKRTMYTGILCGLGADDSGNSIFPEHDMEVIFDCEFTQQDFKTVNKLRFFMSNLLLSKGYPDPVQGQADLISFQQKIKECFLELMEKSRKSKDLEFPEKYYEWNQVQPDVVVCNSKILQNSEISIFPLHSGVSISSQAKEREKLLKHVEELRCNAKTGPEASSYYCQICEIKLINRNFLSLHMASENHLKNEDTLRQMPDYT